MKKAIRFIPLVLGLLLLLSSCSKSSDNTRYISKDAVGVMTINTSSLFKKAAMNLLSGSPILQDMIKDAGGDTSSLDFEKTGIDVLSDIYAYGVHDQRLAGKSKLYVVLSLKDAEKFKAFVKSKFNEAKFETKDKLTLAMLNSNTCMGWNDKTAILLTTPPANEWQDMGEKPQPAADNATILTEEIQKTFALEPSQSLADNKKFTDLIKAGHDIGFWLNYEALAAGMPQDQIGQAGAILASQKKLLKDAFIAGGIDFEKGKITGDATYYFNSSVKAIAQAMEPKSVNNDLLKKVPGTQLNLLLSYHFNPQGIKTVLDTMGVLPLATSALQQAGLSVDDVLNAFSGDFLLAVTDFKVATESQSYTMNGSSVNYTKPVPSYKASLSFRMKDKAAFNKLLQFATANQVLHDAGQGIYSAGFVTLQTNGEFAVVSNDPAVTASFLASTGSSDFKIPAEVKSSPAGFYLDIKNSIQAVPLDLLYGKEDTAVFHDGKALLESISAYSEKLSGDHSKMHFEMAFQNKDENSLMQILKFTQKVVEANKKQGDSFDEVIPENADSTAVEAADTAAPSI